MYVIYVCYLLFVVMYTLVAISLETFFKSKFFVPVTYIIDFSSDVYAHLGCNTLGKLTKYCMNINFIIFYIVPVFTQYKVTNYQVLVLNCTCSLIVQ